ncbi:MAG: alkaline phosphatase family protein [Nitrososphaerota archaeon]|jgi:phospholipase C|nr:alkaline phosphatase family protein [Nitrososphaerota archaeon]
MKILTFLLLIVLLSQILAGSQLGVEASTATPIKHVVIIMMENHSFDNIFGYYPNPNASSFTSTIERPNDLLGMNSTVSLSAVPNGTYSTPNPVESVYYSDWDNGKMDGFQSNSGRQAMTYFTSSQLAIEWDWAELYSIADNYFAGCLCETNPNRLISLSGYNAGLTGDQGPPPYVPVNQTIFSELSRFGISWGYFVPDLEGTPFPLGYFNGISEYSSNVGTVSEFEHDLATGSLPSVSWVMPLGGTQDFSQHPTDNVTEGEVWLNGVVNHIMESSYWNTTAIFITYDEGGGYYDHVPPPALDGIQLGFRVPLFVISPYSKENYVSHTVMNHASTLAFIDYNWGLPALNRFVADSNIPLDMFDFTSNGTVNGLVRQPEILQNDSIYPAPLQIPFNDLPYARSGSTSFHLSAAGAQLYVLSNSTYIPIYQSLPFVLIVAVILLALAYVASKKMRKRT